MKTDEGRRKIASDLSREEVILASEKVTSWKDLISNLGGNLSEAILGTLFPGLEDKLARNRVAQKMADARGRGDIAELQALRSEFMPLSIKVIDHGLSAQQLGMAYKTPATEISDRPKKSSGTKAKKATSSRSSSRPSRSSGKDIDTTNLKPLADGDCESALMSKYIQGYSDRIFRGRRVVVVSRVPGLYGCECVKKPRLQEYSLHNGILNQADLTSDGNPTPYWAVIDAMSELKENFTMNDVLDQAVKTLGGDESKRKACGTAWYVLKTHATHPTKCKAGYCYMLDPVEGKKGHFNIRARREDETFDYFMQKKKKKGSSKKESSVSSSKIEHQDGEADEEQPLATVQVAEVH